MGKPILRDKKGRLMPGTGPLPGAGRPVKKRDRLDKLIEQFYGPDCEQILMDMVEIARYDPVEDRKVNWPKTLSKYFRPKFTNTQVTEARKFLFEHYFGKPIQENHTEISAPDDTEIQIKFVREKATVKMEDEN